MSVSANTRYKRALIRALLRIRHPALMEAFLDDLLTPGECIELGKRLEAVRQLARGVPQREIAQQLHMGVATVTRGSRVLHKKYSAVRRVLD